MVSICGTRRYLKGKKTAGHGLQRLQPNYQQLSFTSPITMATFLPFTSINPQTSHPNPRQRVRKTRFLAKNPTSNSSAKNPESQPENVLLKIAWYGSEFLGVAASLLRSPSKTGDNAGPSSELSLDGFGRIDRAAVVESIKDDFQRSYFVTGNLAVDAYEEDCEFADPAGSFRGLSRFKRNCTNFGYLLEQSNMKLMKWEDFEDKGIGHWRFICIMSFPWKPILSATGYTEYFFDEKSGKVCRHVEHWNVPKMALLKQILRPSRGKSGKKSSLEK